MLSEVDDRNPKTTTSEATAVPDHSLWPELGRTKSFRVVAGMLEDEVTPGEDAGSLEDRLSSHIEQSQLVPPLGIHPQTAGSQISALELQPPANRVDLFGTGPGATEAEIAPEGLTSGATAELTGTGEFEAFSLLVRTASVQSCETAPGANSSKEVNSQGADVAPRSGELQDPKTTDRLTAEAIRETQAVEHLMLEAESARAGGTGFAREAESTEAVLADDLLSAQGPLATTPHVPVNSLLDTSHRFTRDSVAGQGPEGTLGKTASDMAAAEPVRTVEVNLVEADQRVRLRISEHGGELRAHVTAASSELASRLQSGLSDLQRELNGAGFEAEVQRVNAPQSSSASDLQSNSDRSEGEAGSQHGSGAGSGQHSGEQQRNPHSSPLREEEGTDFGEEISTAIWSTV